MKTNSYQIIAESIDRTNFNRHNWSSLWEIYKDQCPKKVGKISKGTTVLILKGPSEKLKSMGEAILTEDIIAGNVIPWNQSYMYVIWSTIDSIELGFIVYNGDIIE